MSTLTKSLLLAWICFASACGPVMQTDYVYIPPKTNGALNCIAECQYSKNQCFDYEEQRYNECENRSAYEREDCEQDIRDRKDRNPKWYECGGSTCSRETEHCESEYRTCYKACGGQIKTETKCVSNCEPIQQRAPFEDRR